MKKEHVFELWECRFKKLLQLEVSALHGYRDILKRYSHMLDGSRIKLIIRGIMRDEIRHVEIGKRLLKIVKTNRGKQVEEG